MTPPEFIENASFRRWVFTNAPDEAAFWADYLARHPDCRESAELARTFLLTAKGNLPDVSDQHVREAIGRILSAAPAQRRSVLHSATDWSSRQPLRVAASVALLLLTGWFGGRYWQSKPTPLARTPSAARPAAAMTELTNRQSAPRLVKLADGSLVVLQQNARMRFPEQFSGPKRDVFLTGNAFFEVVRNPAKPFRVFAGELTTEVLGTSFLISAPETGGKVHVVVKTGKVTVSANPGAGVPASITNQSADRRATDRLPTNRPEPAAVTLLPNQQVTFSKDDARLVKSNVSRAAATVLPATTQAFVFRRTPLPIVLDALARAYGIVIQFDRNELAGCSLTARLDDPSLFARLDVIAASTGSTYALQNGQLVIHSSGCH